MTNGTIFGVALGGESLKHFPRAVTIAAAVCAIIFSIVGVAGKIYFQYSINCALQREQSETFSSDKQCTQCEQL